jgi:tetratricopeptide (TPR) repeat protein
MKAKERHRLKENELAHSISAARDYLEPRRKQIGGVLVVLILIAAAVLGITVIRQQADNESQRVLAEAMVALNARVVPAAATPESEGVPAAAQLGAEGTFATEEAKLNAALPKLKAAADAYPDAETGITARYHMAGALATLGRHKEAIAEFEQVAQRAGDDSLYGRMARLGKADTEAKAGQLDAAIATWKELASSTDEDLPKDAILMELARAYVAKGNQEEARKTFTQLVDEHPTSPYSAEARSELEQIKS